MRVLAVLNGGGGTLRSADVESLCDELGELFRNAGHDFDCRIVAADGLMDALQQAAEDPDVEIVVAGGGDGTVSAAATTCWESGKILGVLPAGTMNLFARSLGLPLDIHDAARALANGKLGTSDIATANGRAFIHQFSVGLHPRMVHARNAYTYRSRLGKMLASARATLETITRPKIFDTEIVATGQRRSERLSIVSVSNNPFGEGHLPYADRLDSGTLGFYRAGDLNSVSALQLATDLMTGSWRENADLRIETHSKITLRFNRLSRSAKCLIDGELRPLESEVTIESHPSALRVLIPASATERSA